MIDFNCPRCGQKVSVQDQHAGGRCRCPYCQTVIAIPAGSAGAPPPVPAPPPTAQLVAPPARPAGGPEPSRTERAALPFPAAQIDAFLSQRRGAVGERFFAAGEQVGYLIAVYGLLAMAFLTLLCAIVRPTDGFRAIPDPKEFVIAAFLLVIGQYVVAKVRVASRRTVRSSPSRISSTHVVDCIAVILLGGAVAALPAAIVYAVGQTDPVAIVFGLLTAALATVVLLLSASLVLNPRALNVEVGGELSAGGEAMGLVSLVLKFVLRVAPLALGGLMVLHAAQLVNACRAVVEYESSLPLVAFIHVSAWPLITFSLAYLGVYVATLLYHLFIDGYAALFEIRDNARHLGPSGGGA